MVDSLKIMWKVKSGVINLIYHYRALPSLQEARETHLYLESKIGFRIQVFTYKHLESRHTTF